MKFNDITKTENIPDSIKKLKGAKPDPKIDLYRNQYEVSDHRPILTQALRPDKIVKVSPDDVEDTYANNGYQKIPAEVSGGQFRLETVNRLAVNLQKRIVQSAVSFTFGKPVQLNCENDGSPFEEILNALKLILEDAKIDSHNRKIMREMARCEEVAEVWFTLPTEENDNYGFTTARKVRVQLFSPWNGNKLYPYYDATGDLVAFSREYFIQENETPIKYFETYTDEETIIWKEVASAWEEVKKTPNAIKKIPVIYGKQDHVEWHDVQSLIDRIEEMLSNFADTNDYFGSPILALTGEVRGMARKDDQGKVINMEQGGKAEFVSWTQGPESTKLEMDTLLRLIYGLSQTPDLSFDSVKGLDLSGIAMKFLFADALLKVEEKREVLDDYLQRRINIIKAYLGTMKTDWKKSCAKIRIKPEIVPFTITSEEDLINLLSTATNGEALLSQESAVEQSGLVKDPKKELGKIKAEQAKKAEQNKLETTF